MAYLLGTLPTATTGLAGEYLLVILVLLLVLVLAYLLTRYLANRGYTYARGKYMQVKESLMVGRDKSILLLEAGNQYYIVGISGQQIQLLATIPAEELRELQQQQPSPAGEGLRGVVARATNAARKFTNAQKDLRNARAATKKSLAQEAALHEALHEALRQAVDAQAEADADAAGSIASMDAQENAPQAEETIETNAEKKSTPVGRARANPRKLEIVKRAPATEGAPAAQSAPVREQPPAPASNPPAPARQAAKAAKPSFESILEQAGERLLTGGEEPAVIVDLSGGAPSPKAKPAKAAAKRKEDEIDKMMQSIEKRTEQLRQRRRTETPPHEGD